MKPPNDTDTEKRLRDLTPQMLDCLYAHQLLDNLCSIESDFDTLFSSKAYCLHCGKTIQIGNARIIANPSFISKINPTNPEGWHICCPNWPECNGTAIDFMPLHWKDIEF